LKKKNHKILDHPIWGYFLLAAFGFVLMGLGSMGDSAINVHILHLPPGNTAKVGSGIATAAAALVAAGLYKLWFRPDFKGSIQIKGLLTGILMLLPVMIVHYAGSIVSWATFGTGSVLLAFLQCFAPGFGEEIAFRGMGVANYMRTIKSEKQILVIFPEFATNNLIPLSHTNGGVPPVKWTAEKTKNLFSSLITRLVFYAASMYWVYFSAGVSIPSLR
jgi:hypothetical protein